MLILTGLYASAALVFTLSILFYFNNFYLVDNANINTVSDFSNVKVGNSGATSLAVTDIPLTAKDIFFSNDNKYCMYLNDGNIYIKSVGTNKTLTKISENSKIKNAILLNDRNIIMYFTLNGKPGSNYEKVNIKTYNIDNNENILQQSLSIKKGYVIKSVDYSSLTNLIVINTAFINKNNKPNQVYYVNIMKKVKGLKTQNTVNNMVLLNRSLSLYYQNKNGILYCNSKIVDAVSNKKISLLGCDSNDNVYLSSLTDRKRFYVLNNNRLIDTLTINNADYIKFIAKKTGIYAVYSSYVIDLTKDIKTRINFNKRYTFMDMIEGKVYLKDKNNRVMIEFITNKR